MDTPQLHLPKDPGVHELTRADVPPGSFVYGQSVTDGDGTWRRYLADGCTLVGALCGLRDGTDGICFHAVVADVSGYIGDPPEVRRAYAEQNVQGWAQAICSTPDGIDPDGTRRRRLTAPAYVVRPDDFDAGAVAEWHDGPITRTPPASDRTDADDGRDR